MSKEASKQYVIAVGLDGSNSSWKALDEAIQQAVSKKAQLHIVSIQESVEASYSASEVLEIEKTSREKLEGAQVTALNHVADKGIEASTAIVVGSSAAAMVEYVKKNKIDLLVVGETGHSSIWGALLGTTAEKIVRQAPCSVLIVR